MYKDAAFNDIGKINAKRLLWGSNSQDIVIGCPCPNDTTNVTMSDILLIFFNNNETIVNKILNYYPTSDFDESESAAFFGLNSDVCVTCPMLNVNDMFANGPFVNSDDFSQYSYYFEGISEPYQAGHGSELVFLLLGYLPRNAQSYGMKFNKTLSQQMINAWQTFANITDINSVMNDKFEFYDPETDVEFEWFEYNSTTNGSVLQLNQYIENLADFRNKSYRNGVCKFWNENIDYETRFNLCSNTQYY